MKLKNYKYSKFQSEALEKAEGMLTQSVVVQVEENDQVSVFA